MFDTQTSQFTPEVLPGQEGSKKRILLIVIPLAVIIILVAAFLFFKKDPIPPTNVAVTPTTTIAFLTPDVSTVEEIATSTIPDAIEKITWADFYTEPAPLPQFKGGDYELPLNIKIDTLNYYDVSRKLDLSQGVDSLNQNGLALLDNPAPQEINDVYSAYSFLLKRDVPVLITSDFLLHYHQNVVKKIFKDIEENIFYDNVENIIRKLYESSKNRYEARLAKIGPINDSVLEGERLAVAYFAVALKLLEPNSLQIDPSGKDPNKFTSTEAQGLYFNILPYLQNDVSQELSLIKSASVKKKSPVLLYEKDYAGFKVPEEYKTNEKLYNFYLASTWLNSVFPLVVKDKNCPTCLLDKDDSYLSLIAVSFITKDFASDQELKNRWALVYKLISYQKGLRDDLTYLNYDQEMKKLFGENYDPETIFAERNSDKAKNLDKFRANLLAISFNDFQGAFNRKTEQPRLGFKLLTDHYWPNDYIFNRLRMPSVGVYQGAMVKAENVTACFNSLGRCGGFSLDIMGLIRSRLPFDNYWKENTNYASYDQKLAALRAEFEKTLIWYTNRFWSILGTLKMMFEENNGQMQAYHETELWQKRLVDSGVAAWLDLQLPLENLLPGGEENYSGGLSNSILSNTDSYIEPNYALVQKLIADNEMIYGMMEALNINKQVSSVSLTLKEENEKLQKISHIIKKELDGEALSSDDHSFIESLAKQYKLASLPTQSLTLKFDNAQLRENIGIKLMALVYQLGDGKFIAIGPVFSFSERR